MATFINCYRIFKLLDSVLVAPYYHTQMSLVETLLLERRGLRDFMIVMVVVPEQDDEDDEGEDDDKQEGDNDSHHDD